jgi:SAM-dependent methyltransferase
MVMVADLTREPLNQQFDLIVAGEVLEHVDAPGKFMKNCAAMLRPDGRLAITVPNPWYVNAVLKSALRSQTFVDSADHVCWYDASTLVELGQRNGFASEVRRHRRPQAEEDRREIVLFTASPHGRLWPLPTSIRQIDNL